MRSRVRNELSRPRGGPSGRKDIGRIGPLVKAPRAEVSNRAGRLGWFVALIVVGGGVLLWMLGTARTGRGQSDAGREAPPVEVAEETPLAPTGPLAPASTLEPAGELEPFAGARGEARPASAPGTLRGHVEVSGEEPFPRAWTLTLRPSATLPRRETADTRTLEFTAGEKDFEVRDLPLGGYDVVAQAEGFNGRVQAIALEPGNEHPFVNLRMVPAGILEGRVLEWDGVPAEGIPVTLFSVSGSEVFEATSDVRGIYRFESLPDGAYELLFGKASAPLIPERRPVRFAAPSLTFPDTELPQLGAIAMRVVDSLERPLEGILVRGSGTNGGVVEGRTDYDGRLLVKHLPPGHFRLRLSRPGEPESRDVRRAVDVFAGKVTEAPIGFFR